ncbi:MAG: 30S ribosomal protein S18 [Deltaproteobacteria bacterium]|nr:30S ribosomal protein S18 [Deltaproteobacteria bacterium]
MTTSTTPSSTATAPTKSRNQARRRLQDYFLQNKGVEVDFKNTELMRRFISPEGKILPGRRTGLSSKNQRKVTKAVKRARAIGLLPFTNHDA